MPTVELYSQQYDFATSPATRAAFIGGIGSGKTLAGAVRSLNLASQHPRSFGMITAPTLDILRDASLRLFFGLAGDAVADHNKNEKKVYLRNGSEFIYRTTSDPEALRGTNLTWVWMDEAALSDETAYKICTGRAREGGRAGYVFPTTTPRGRNWVYQRWIEEPQEGYEVYRATSYDNPVASSEWLASQERELTGDFRRQELYAEFVTFEGLVYEEFNREVHIWHGELPQMVDVVAGVDWGYTNPAVILVIGFDSDDRAYVLDEYYRRQVRLEEHIAAADEMKRRFGISLFYPDPSEPEHITEMQRAGLPVAEVDNAVMPGIQAVKARLAIQADGRPRLYYLPHVVNTIAEVESYQWAERMGGLIDQPEKSNSHAMDAKRYPIYNRDRDRYVDDAVGFIAAERPRYG